MSSVTTWQHGGRWRVQNGSPTSFLCTQGGKHNRKHIYMKQEIDFWATHKGDATRKAGHGKKGDIPRSTLFYKKTRKAGEHGQPRRELNLLGALETPTVIIGEEGASQTVIPTTVLNNPIMSQQNLTSLVSSLSAQVKAGSAAPRGEHMRTLNVLMAPYPSGYQPPTFRKFDGTESTREHLMSFLDDLGVHIDNANLRLKEFSKSLSGRAFTWYSKLRPSSIKAWEELAVEFCSKFLEEEGVLHIMDLGRVKQKSGEGLVTFIKRYRDRALQCKETLPEADLVYGCIKNIEDGSQIFLSLGGITTFVELMRKAADVAEAMKRQDRGKRKTFRGGPSPGKSVPYNTEDLPTIPLARPQVCQLVEEWLKDGTLRVKMVKPPLKKEQYDNPTYCILHRTNTHTTIDCWTVRRAFERQVRLGKVLLPEGEGGELHRRPLPNHRISTITSRASNLRIEEIEEDFQTEEEILPTRLLKTRGFRVLFSQMGLNPEVHKEAAMHVVRITKKHEGDVSAASAPLTRIAKAHASAIIFREPPSPSPQFCHNRPLYIEAMMEGVHVRRALVDNGSGVNILPTYLFNKLRIPQNRMRGSNITLSTFHGEAVEARGALGIKRETPPRVEQDTWRGMHPVTAHKKPKVKELGKIQREVLPNGEVRWRIL
ncbi:Retrotransposon gag domain [Sesbania bispinosa]|nr:Retrotransposon gag domain [Sesbania bispinosa]